MRYVPGLDGLRALAVLSVIGFHVRPDRVPGGWIGVELFFVLSGYLITRLLLAEHARTGAIDLRGFYRRRALRLMPALAALLVLTALIVPWFVHVPWLPIDLAAGATYLWDLRAGFGHPSPISTLWSLGVEEQFYLGAPWVLRRAVRNRGALPRRALTATVIAMAVCAGWTLVLGPRWVVHTPIGHTFELLLGGFLATVSGARVRTLVAAASLAALAAAVVTMHEVRVTFYGPLFVVAFACAAVVLHVATQESAVSRALASRPLVAIGQRSYGAYLYHLPIIWIVNAHLPGRASWLVVFAATGVVTALSYRFVERPFLLRKSRPRAPVDTGFVAGSGAH
ncbi:MAG TPA: acyltransferase [Mycobacteriales bacterium]|nr:acyltransferase [Mycobacteriales bacterium]